jgi:hypothetical protein
MRNKKLVIVIGTKKAIAIKSDKKVSRYTYLSERLRAKVSTNVQVSEMQTG